MHGGGWLARLRGKGRGGWSVEEHSWVCSEGPVGAGHGLRGAVAGWYLPVLVVDEKRLSRGEVHRAGNGGHRVEGKGQRTLAGNGAGSSEKGMGEGYGARQGT